MPVNRKYCVQFSNLNVGEHLFELEIDKEFFDNFPYSEIKDGKVKVLLNLLKRTNLMVLGVEISGTVQCVCDRCAAEMELPISSSQTLIVKVSGSDNVENIDEDVIFISSSDSEIDLMQHLYDYIILSLPIKREHINEEDCDSEVIEKLNTIVVNESDSNESDPRWDELAKLKLN